MRENIKNNNWVHLPFGCELRTRKIFMNQQTQSLGQDLMLAESEWYPRKMVSGKRI